MCYIHYIAIATHSEAGSEVNEYASQGRAQSIARVGASGETVTGRSVERKNGDGFAVIGGALEGGARLCSYLCQALEFITYHKSKTRRVTTFIPIDINIYKLVGFVVFAEIHAFGRSLASCANLCQFSQRVKAGWCFDTFVKNTFSGGAHLVIYRYILFHVLVILYVIYNTERPEPPRMIYAHFFPCAIICLQIFSGQPEWLQPSS